MSNLFVNNASTTLSAAITSATATTISVTSGWGFPISGNFLVVIDAETMTVTGVSGTTWTVTRGVGATTHSLGAIVTATLTIYASMFGALGDGTTDDTVALQNAVNLAQSSGGLVLLAPKSVYSTTSAIIVSAPITIDGCGSTIRNISGTYPTNSAIQVLSTVGSSIGSYTGSGIAAGDNVLGITISAATLPIGTTCLLNLGIDPYDATLPHWQGIARILANTGTSLTIDTAIPYAINSPSSTVPVQIISSLAENIVIKNLIFDTTAYTAITAVSVIVARNVAFENIGLLGTQIAFQPAENVSMDNIFGFITASDADQQHAIRMAKVNGFRGDNFNFTMNEQNEVIFAESQSLNLHIGTLRMNGINASSGDCIAVAANSSMYINHFIITCNSANPPQLSNEFEGGSLIINTLECNGPFFSSATMERVGRLILNGLDYGVAQSARITLPLVASVAQRISLNACFKKVLGKVNQVPTPADWGVYIGTLSGSHTTNIASLLSAGAWVDLTPQVGTWGSDYGGGVQNNPSDPDKAIVAYQGNGTIPSGTTIELDIQYWPTSVAGTIG